MIIPQNLLANAFVSISIMLVCTDAIGQCGIPSTLPTGLGPRQIATADLNNDNIPDLVVASNNTPAVQIHISNGKGGLLSTQEILGNGARYLELADFDLDGDVDIAILFTGLIAIFENDGFGLFSFAQQFGAELIQGDASIISFENGDLNGDGFPDFIGTRTTGFPAQGRLSIFLSDGKGGFHDEETVLIESGCSFLVIGDYNQDGNLDVATATLSLNIRFGNGDGTFQAPEQYGFGSNYLYLVASDIDADGDLDIATSSADDDQITIFYNDSGNFDQDEVVFEFGSGNFWLEIADLNNDSHGDLVVSRYHSSRSHIVLSNGDGTFSESMTIYSSGNQQFPGNTAIADLNGDAFQDVLVTCQNSNTLTIHYGLGEGQFETGQTDFIESSPVEGYSRMEAGDVNNDGHPDLVGADLGRLGILLSNGTGEFNVNDLTPIGIGDLALEDLNGDGFLDVVTQRSFDDSLRTYLGNGEGKFFGGNQSYAGAAGNFAIGDLNGDSIPDLLTARAISFGNGISVFIGLGDGQFAPVEHHTISGASSERFVASAELNNDEFDDAIVATNNEIYVLFGNGDADFSADVEFVAESDIGSLEIGDFNNDSALDIAVVSRNFETIVQIFINDGNGHFDFLTWYRFSDFDSSAKIHAVDLDVDGNLDLAIHRGPDLLMLYGSGNGSFYQPNDTYDFVGPPAPRQIRSADLNGDSVPELIVEKSPFLILQRSGCFLPGDINQDGVVDLLDVFPFVELLINGEFLAQADINGDGSVDLLDVDPFVGLLIGG